MSGSSFTSSTRSGWRKGPGSEGGLAASAAERSWGTGCRGCILKSCCCSWAKSAEPATIHSHARRRNMSHQHSALAYRNSCANLFLSNLRHQAGGFVFPSASHIPPAYLPTRQHLIRKLLSGCLQHLLPFVARQDHAHAVHRCFLRLHHAHNRECSPPEAAPQG